MAGAKVRGITIDLGVDASGVASGLRSVNSSLNATSKELKDIDRLLKLDPGNVTLLAQKHEALQRAVSQTRDKLNLLKNAEEELKAQMVDGGTEEQQRQLEALQREIISTERDLNKYESQLNETEGETKELARSTEQAEQATEKMKQGFTVLKGALANLVADGIRKAVEGFKDLMTAGPAFADEILTLSSKTGIATDKLQELSYMSGLVDVDVSTVASSMKKLTKSMDSARDGTGASADAFRTLGVSVVDINGNLRDNEDVFYDTIDALGKMENETERDAIAMQVFGKSATDLNPMIEAGGDALREFADEAHEMGYVLDKDALQALGRVQDEFDRFGKQMEVVKNQIAAGVAPAIERGMKKIQEVIKKIDWNKIGQQIGKAFEGLIDAFEWIIKNGTMIKSILTGVVSALAANKIVSFVSALGSMVSALKAATVAQEGLNAAANANPYVLLASVIVGLGAALISWQKSLAEAARAADESWQATDRLTQAASDQIAVVGEIADSYNTMKEAREASVNSGMAELANVQSLYSELQGLADANGVVAESDKARAQFILNELNKALGTEYTMTGNQISQYQTLAGSINEVIQKKQAELILAAQEEAYAAAITGRAEAEQALMDIENQKFDIETQIAENTARMNELMSATGPQLAANAEEIGKLYSQNLELNSSLSDLNAAYQESADVVDQYAYDVVAYETNMTNALNGQYDQIQYKSWETAKAEGTATNAASREVAANAQNANTAWKNNLENMLSTTTGSEVEFRDAGDGMIQAYVDGQKAGEPMTYAQLNAMRTAMRKNLDQMKAGAQASGQQVPAGVASGIYSGSGSAYSAVSQLARNIIANFQANMKIQSPSKVFAEFGGFMVEGVAEGIEENEGIALDAIDEFSDDLTKAMNPSGGFSTMVSGGGIASVGSAMSSEAGILNLLTRYLPELADRDVTLDGDTIVGKLAPKYNKQFGRLETLNARGV